MNFESQLYYWTHMLDEAMDNKCFICEDKEGKNINRAEKWIKDNHSEVIGQKLQNGTTITPRILTQEIRNAIPNVRMVDCKFLVGITRLYFENQDKRDEIQSIFSSLNKMLKIICIAHADEYDNNLNGLSFDELDKKFSGAVQHELDSDREEIGKLQLIKNQVYKIVPINSFEEAKKYGKYTSWCVTHYEDMFDSYTKGGLGRFYFCLKPGFEKVQTVKGKDCPLDEYGKSMIAISVNDDGSLNTCTCRWNHDNGGNDNMMNTKEISEFFGVNFYKTFVPYTTDQLMQKYEDMTDGYDQFSVSSDTRRCKDENGNVFYVTIENGKIIKYFQAGIFYRDSSGNLYRETGKKVESSEYSGNPDDYEVGDMISVKFEGKQIPWIVLDKTKDSLVVQSYYALEQRRPFDKDGSNKWKNSALRNYLNSSEFFNKFDENFISQVIETEVKTGKDITRDKFWLLAQEEVGEHISYMQKTDSLNEFKAYSNKKFLRRLNVNGQPCYWWLRSAYSYGSNRVGYVDYYGNVYHNFANGYSGVLPACTIR